MDFSALPPRLRKVVECVEDAAEDGQRLPIVEHLADAWGTDPLPWGKRVWAELRDGR